MYSPSRFNTLLTPQQLQKWNGGIRNSHEDKISLYFNEFIKKIAKNEIFLIQNLLFIDTDTKYDISNSLFDKIMGVFSKDPTIDMFQDRHFIRKQVELMVEALIKETRRL